MLQSATWQQPEAPQIMSPIRHLYGHRLDTQPELLSMAPRCTELRCALSSYRHAMPAQDAAPTLPRCCTPLLSCRRSSASLHARREPLAHTCSPISTSVWSVVATGGTVCEHSGSGRGAGVAPANIRRCWMGGMPSFSSTLSLIRSTVSVGSMSISISRPVRVLTLMVMPARTRGSTRSVKLRRQ